MALIESLRAPAAPGEPAGLAELRREVGELLAELQIFTRPPADALWRAAGHDTQPWRGCNEDAAAQLIARTGARAVLTGTSDVDEPGDRALWRAARSGGLPSHAILDQKVNLDRRFMDGDGAPVHPDWLYVTDPDYAAALRGVGVPPARIRIVGDLHGARMRRRVEAVSPQEVASLRAAWGVADERCVVLFVSECGREMAAAGRPQAYDEVEEFECLLAAIEGGTHALPLTAPGSGVAVVVRPHPRDTRGKYDGVRGERPCGLVVRVSAEGEPEVALKAADVIVGMNSSLLHEARIVGRAAVSLTRHPLAGEPGAAW